MNLPRITAPALAFAGVLGLSQFASTSAHEELSVLSPTCEASSYVESVPVGLPFISQAHAEAPMNLHHDQLPTYIQSPSREKNNVRGLVTALIALGFPAAYLVSTTQWSRGKKPIGQKAQEKLKSQFPTGSLMPAAITMAGFMGLYGALALWNSSEAEIANAGLAATDIGFTMAIPVFAGSVAYVLVRALSK